MPAPADPFGTARHREAVLAGWRSVPARFREDANAEEDLVLGGYRDRLVVEIAQNAADAAAAAGVPGLLHLRLTGDTLVAGNVGTPLSAEGVLALATLRASAKRGDATGPGGGQTGRFGVGFAAVLAVSDEPSLRSRGGGVTFSAARTRELLSGEPALAAELARRDGRAPVLRLPFPDPVPPTAPYDSEVVLPLRDAEAYELARTLLDEVDQLLLVGLPGLAEVRVDGVSGHGSRVLRASRTDGGVVVADDGAVTTWRLASGEGRLPDDLLAGRPVEERSRPWWSVRWALPVDPAGHPTRLPRGVRPVLHAPTPTDEPVDLPAVLLAGYPLDPDRRHVVTGPLADLVTRHAAEAYVELVTAVADDVGPAALALVPGPVPVGPLDGRLRVAVRDSLAAAPVLPLAAPDAGDVEPAPTVRVRGRDASLVADAAPDVVRTLAQAYDGLLDPAWSGGGPSSRGALEALGVRRLPLADALERLVEVRRPASWWAQLYGALDRNGAVATALSGLPVPLADGRVVSGPRGLVVPGPDVDPRALAALGLRVVDPAAAHPLLLRLGAVPAEPAALLSSAAVRAAVEASLDADDPGPVSEAVLGLVAAAGGGPAWLGDLALPDADGGWSAAGSLTVAGSPLADVLVSGALGTVRDDVVARWGAETLAAAGVAVELAVLTAEDVPLDPDAVEDELDVDGAALWADALRAELAEDADGAVLAAASAVRDLELVRTDAWPRVLTSLAGPALRAAVTDPVRVLLPGGGAVDAVPYTAWWLGRQPVLAGCRPTDVRLPQADPRLTGLYDPVPDPAAHGLDDAFLVALGVRSSLEGALRTRAGVDDLLDRLADPDRAVDPDQLAAVYRAVARLSPSRWPTPPAQVRVPMADTTRVATATEVVVAVAPHHLALVSDHVVLPGTTALADALDLDTTDRLAATPVTSQGRTCLTPAAARALLPTVGAAYVEHDDLVVGGRHVDWWVDDSGRPHAATPDGLARALAWAAGSWGARWALAEALADSSRLPELVAEAAYDAAPSAD